MARTIKMDLTHVLLCVITIMVVNQILSSNAQTTTTNDTTAMYVFGDSLYDTGMGLYNSGWPVAQYWPYGMSYFTPPPSGRFSDGRLIPDFIAQYANMSFPQPYLKPGISYTAAVNFAVCSSGVLVDTRPKMTGLTGQVQYLLQMVQDMKSQMGENETTKVMSNAVYLFNTGGNDYVEMYNFNTKPLSPSLVSLKLSQVLGNLSTHFTTIYNQGGRKFAYNNIAPLGCLPAFLLANGTCNPELNELARKHNAGFMTLVQQLQTQLPGSRFSVYNFYSALAARLTYGSKYGFGATKTACCGSGPYNGQFSCQKEGQFNLCSNPATYLWFDAGHTSQSANKQFSQEFWSGSTSFVSPYNLKSLFAMRF